MKSFAMASKTPVYGTQFKEFVPKRENVSMIQPNKQETMSSIVDRINVWKISHPSYRIHNLETLKGYDDYAYRGIRVWYEDTSIDISTTSNSGPLIDLTISSEHSDTKLQQDNFSE